MVTLELQLVEVELGKADFTGVPGLHAYNPLGVVHGGYAATRPAAVRCIRAHRDAGVYDPRSEVAYQKPLTAETGPVRAEGRVLSTGRRAAFSDASLKDARGRLHASATSTRLVFDR
jgi:acyl-coenzyme A thioesterase PaaI-like protein